ncbi:MAG: hypothetical protein K0S12_187 [Bacteroidetes bacterium]|nr:hypothetical protein [Bacteroidota bacterium]
MKKITTHLLALVAIVVIMASCGDSMSLTKRHYRNGYHFERSGKSSTPAKHQQAYSKHTVDNSERIDEEKVVSASDTTIASPPLYNPAPQKKSKSSPEGLTRIKPLDRSGVSSARILPAAHVDQEVKGEEITASGDSDDDSLSLFGLVILIILLIWVFGFFAGGWGLGGLINILLVIALVLLILWLLKVI